MQRLSQNILLKLASKAVVTAAMLFVLFAPTMQIFETPITLAQTTSQGSLDQAATNNSVAQSNTPANPSNTLCDPSGSGFCGSNGSPVNPTTLQTAQQGGSSYSCNITSPSTWDLCISNIVYVFTVGLGSGLAFVGAYFLDITVNLSLNSYAYALDFISQGWTAVRDIANMAFILVLVYIAYIILLEAETVNTYQMLAWVIFIALIINFSFFLTRIVIDAGNIVAVQFYNAIPNHTMADMIGLAGSPGGSVASTITGAVGPQSTLANTKDITYNIMQGLNLQGAFNNDAFKQFYTSTNWMSTIIILSFLYVTLGIFFFMLAAMLIAAGIKFMFRIVMLWFAIIAAPAALVCKAIPGWNKYFNDWRRMLVQNTFYPAIFLFIFILISNLMGSLGTFNGGLVNSIFGSISQAGSEASGFQYLAVAIGVIGIRMGLLLALLYVAMLASDKVSAYGANIAHVATDWLQGKAGNIARFGAGLPLRGATAGAAYGLRQTAGQGGYRLSRSQLVNDFAANNIFGRPLKAALAGLGRSTFDVRNTEAGKGIFSVGGLTNIGKGGKNGFEQNVDQRAKDIEKRAKALKEVNESQIKAAQQAKEQEYDEKNGPGTYKLRVGSLRTSREYEQKIIADQTEAQRSAALRGDATAAKAAETAIKEARKREKNLGDELGKLEGMGKKQLEDAGKARVRAFAERLKTRNFQNLGMPSLGSLEGAAKATKLVTEKSTKDKLADIVKDYNKEEGGEETSAPATPAPTTPAPTATSHALTRQSLDQTRARGPLDASTTKLVNAIDKLANAAEKETSAIERGNKLQMRTFKATGRIAEAIDKQENGHNAPPNLPKQE